MNAKKIAAFAIGPIGGALLGFISLPIITWFFSQQDIGRISMLQITLSFSTLLFSLGLDQAYVREFHSVKNKPALFKMVLLPGLSLLLLMSICMLVYADVIAVWLFDVADWYLGLLVVIALVATFLSRFLSLILRMNEKGLLFSMSQLLPKLLFLLIVASYVLLNINKNLTNLISATVASVLLIFIILMWFTRNDWLVGLNAKVEIPQTKALLQFGFPLIFGGLAFWGLTAMDKVFLRTLSSFQQLGLYSVAVSFAAAATILQTVFSTVWAPIVYKMVANNESTASINKVNRYVLLCVIMLFCLGGLLSWLVLYILPEAYKDVRWILVSCLAFPLFYALSETTVVGIGVSRRTNFALLASVLALIINLVGNYMLVPALGAKGAAISTCIAFYVFFILRTEFAIFLWQPIPRTALYTYATLLVIGAIIHTGWGEAVNQFLILYWAILLLSTLLFFKTEYTSAWQWGASLLRKR